MQSSPIYASATNAFKEGINEWEAAQPEPVIAATIRRALFSGDKDFKVSPDVIRAITGTDKAKANANAGEDGKPISGYEVSEDAIAKQMGYDSVDQYTKDLKEAGKNKESEQSKEFFEARNNARAAVARNKQNKAIQSLLGDDKTVAELIQLAGEGLQAVDGVVRGANFYRANQNAVQAYSGNLTGSAWDTGFGAMSKIVGADLIDNLKAGQEPPFSDGVLDFNRTYLCYVRKLNEAQKLSDSSTPLQLSLIHI